MCIERDMATLRMREHTSFLQNLETLAASRLRLDACLNGAGLLLICP